MAQNDEDLASFVAKSLYDLDMQTKYLHNWHIDLMCEYLMKVYFGKIKRLIINIPPRSLKSVCINVAFPAWILAKQPAEKIISVSYSQALALKHSTDCRKIMTSSWYEKDYKTRINAGENEKKKFVTNKNGYRFATSVGGTLTGEGGNFIIVDDPQNPSKIHTKKEQDGVSSWFESVLSSRLNNKKQGRIVIVMQRLHQNDLTGFLLSKPNSSWNLLSIPSICENDGFCFFDGKILKYRGEGKILQSLREEGSFVEKSMLELGSFTFSSQYQQEPLTKSGVLSKDWFLEFDTEPDFESIFFSIDTAVSTKGDSDFTVIMKFGVFQNCYYITEIINKRMDYCKTKEIVIGLAECNKSAVFLIEDKNVGSSLISEIKTKTKSFVVPILPLKDKITRLFNVINLIESRRVFIKKNAHFIKDFLLQVSTFPNSSHDDQIDAMTQFLNYIKNKNDKPKSPKIRML